MTRKAHRPKEPEWKLFADFHEGRGGAEIAPGVTLNDSLYLGDLVYLTFENAQFGIWFKDTPVGKQSQVSIAIPRKVAACFMPVKAENPNAISRPKFVDACFARIAINEVEPMGLGVQATGTIGEHAFFLDTQDGLSVQIGTPDGESPIGIHEKKPFWCYVDDQTNESEIQRIVRLAYADFLADAEKKARRKMLRARRNAKPSKDAG
jgi:hypothetical protein